MSTTTQRIAASDGRMLEVMHGGAPTGPALMLHHGTPLEAGIWADWDDAVARAGLQLLACSRPGYAGSTRRAGRRVADVAVDVAAILERFAAPWFVTAGWSGGGPHALASAALVPGCRAVATIAGVAPSGRPNLDFLAGMGPENVAEFGAAMAGETALRAWMRINGAPFATVTAPEMAQALGGLVPQADKDVLVGGYAERLAASTRRSLAAGLDGWIDDDLAFAADWGFDLAALRVPATVWQGDLDLMVPFAHGQWLLAAIPDARARMVAGHGHISLGIAYRDEIIAALLADAAALPAGAIHDDG